LRGLTLSEYLDACYAVIVSSGGAFADPFKFRRSVYTLIATGEMPEDDRDEDERESAPTPTRQQQSQQPAAQNAIEKPPQSALDALKAMRDKVIANNNNAGETQPVE